MRAGGPSPRGRGGCRGPHPDALASAAARGHNQAEAVAREIAAGLGRPCEPGWLRRVTAATQHAQSTASARRENVRGAFLVTPRAKPAGRTVLLVDDVMTTGSTLSEAAGVLKAAGAGKVVAAFLARR